VMAGRPYSTQGPMPRSGRYLLHGMCHSTGGLQRSIPGFRYHRCVRIQLPATRPAERLHCSDILGIVNAIQQFPLYGLCLATNQARVYTPLSHTKADGLQPLTAFRV
jgi:hypothetical protein